jgi:hypothetical protein
VHQPGNAKSFISSHFIHFPPSQSGSFLPHKNKRFMTDFCGSQFVNNSQKLCALPIGKVMQGKARVFLSKKFRIFYGHFYGKSLGNPAKTAKKTAQICPKNTRFLMQKNYR